MNDAEDAARWRMLVKVSNLGFEGAPSWSAVVRISTVSSEHATLVEIIDARIKAEGGENSCGRI